jgi:hypothetical protein
LKQKKKLVNNLENKELYHSITLRGPDETNLGFIMFNKCSKDLVDQIITGLVCDVYIFSAKMTNKDGKAQMTDIYIFPREVVNEKETQTK